MDHGPAIQTHESEELKEYKQKLGLKLFFAYALFYLVFVGINTLFPSLMETVVFLGLNLAVVYGFSLIIIAVIMGVIYNHYCTRKEISSQGESK